jgi:transposase
MPNKLTETQILSLKLAHKKIHERKLADRIKALLSLDKGYSYEEVAEILLLDETTLRRYQEIFQESGVEGLLKFYYKGGTSELTIIQTNELEVYLTNNTLHTSQQIREYILNKYHINYSLTGVTKLMHRLKFSYKKPKILPGKLDPIKQAQFMIKYKELKELLKPKDQIYFLDATHPTHNTTASYGWIKIGREGDKYLETNTGRGRLNINGALNLRTHQAIVFSEITINAQSVIKILKRLIKDQPHGKIHLILDNAMYYRANIVKKWQKHHRRVEFHFLPPYSPNLNIIERLWLFFHRKITNSHYFSTFLSFKRTTIKFFKHLDKYESELKTLLTDNFQTFPDHAFSKKLQT